jgi:multidrug efflux pump subunit AcrA (membrane-fusion protein)
MAITLKLDEAGHAVLQEGKVVYFDDVAGKDLLLDGGHLYTRVVGLTAENASHRAAKTAAETALKAYEGITDPAAALAALQTVADIDAGTLLTAGKAEEVRIGAMRAAEATVAAAAKVAADQIAAATALNESLAQQLHQEKIGGAFQRSKYIAEKIAVPVDMVQATFGGAFKIEDGKVVATRPDGTKIFNTSGEPAGFDEALIELVNGYPHKDSILKGSIAAGGGAQGGAGGTGGKTLARSAFEKLTPADRAAKMKEGYTLTEG